MAEEVQFKLVMRDSNGVLACAAFQAQVIWLPLDPRDRSKMGNFSPVAPLDIQIFMSDRSVRWMPEKVQRGLWQHLKEWWLTRK